MADIKTTLRELSVAITIGLKKEKIIFHLSDLYSSKQFLKYAHLIISNDISKANNLINYNIFPKELQTIILNGYKLGCSIYNNSYFQFDKSMLINWVGNDIHKDNPIDIYVGNYGFSLKEDSFILKNMGLYQLLNILTGSKYTHGLHVFNTFAHSQYNEWFCYTWECFVNYLAKRSTWKLEKGNNISKAYISEENIILSFNNEVSSIPINITTNEQFMKHTVSKTREKVFSKWINLTLNKDLKYIALKKQCSEVAGKQVCAIINSNFKLDNICDFFQICPNEYYYAKTTPTETLILKVPAKNVFSSQVKFQHCRYEVPTSQLNIITIFQNKDSKKLLEFRNECRFSHGQFNGTPEAKMYISHNTPLTNLYELL